MDPNLPSHPLRILEAPLIAVLLAIFTRTFLLQGVLIATASMEPGLLPGDHVFVNKLVFADSPSGAVGWLLPQRRVRRSDVVVFTLPEEPQTLLVKRCVGLPGETIEIVDHGVRINGRPLDERAYLDHSGTSAGIVDPHMAEVVVPEGHLFVLGDSRNNSLDSRSFGAVPLSAVTGRVTRVYWSFDVAPEAGNLGRFGRLMRFARDLIPRTRWRRTFKVVP